MPHGCFVLPCHKYGAQVADARVASYRRQQANRDWTISTASIAIPTDFPPSIASSKCIACSNPRQSGFLLSTIKGVDSPPPPPPFASHVHTQVRFDSGVLLDWLISPETSFLPYITRFLRVSVAEWSDFAARVSGASLASLGSDRCSGGPASTNNEEEGEGEEELVLSEAEAERLNRVMSCLSELLAIARALQIKGLAPYNLAPLLRRIEQIVLLYEDCGDAENESDTCSDSSGGVDLNGAATSEHAHVDISSVAQNAKPYGVETCDSSIERSSII